MLVINIAMDFNQKNFFEKNPTWQHSDIKEDHYANPKKVLDLFGIIHHMYVANKLTHHNGDNQTIMIS